MSRVIVTGITTGFKPTDPVSALPKRLEWQTFVQNLDFVTLYVLALQQFQAEDQSVTLSYFQITGIHGLPYIPWNGIQGDNASTGYCNHGMNTFPTWHRPYVALYEQQLASYFPSIIQSYQNGPFGAQLANSAQSWRLPYWDWAINPTMPAEWNSTQITIHATSGGTTAVSNPLVAYRFHPIDSSFDGTPYAQWQTTLRAPSSRGPSARSQPQRSNSALSNDGRQFKNWVLDLFQTPLPEPDTWGQISNDMWQNIHPGQGSLTSIESIHDQIHGDIGLSGGHMGDPSVAAFDPIFWLHHCNVDRLLALWSAAFPSVFVSPGPNTEGTFVQFPEGADATDINQDTPLEPFSKSQSDFATSLDCYSTGVYGYTYPEIAAAGPVSPDSLSQFVIQQVDQLYGGGSFFSAFTVPKDRSSDVAMESLTHSMQTAFQPVQREPGVFHIPKFRLFSKKNNPRPGPPSSPPVASGSQGAAKPHNNPEPAPSGPQGGVVHPEAEGEHYPGYKVTPDNYRQWIANVTLEKYALGGSGRIAFFLGPEDQIPTDPKEWYTSPLYVGAYSIFAQTNPTTSGCSNCKTQAERHMRVGGTVHLTESLIRHHIPLQGDEPIEYLKNNLHWRASDCNEEEIRREDIPSLKVVVQSAGVVLPPGGGVGSRPIRSIWTRHAHVTRGKPGGVNREDEF